MTTTTFGAGSLVGVPVRRVEDPTLLRGEGTYIDNLPIAGVLHLAFVRSPIAHAEIRSIDTNDARAMPGVVAVYTADDLDFPDHTGMMQLHPGDRAARARARQGALRGRPRRGGRRREQGPGRRRRRGGRLRLRRAARRRRHGERARARLPAPVRRHRVEHRRWPVASPTTSTPSSAPRSSCAVASRTSASPSSPWRERRSRSFPATTARVTSSPCTSGARCPT